MIEENGGKSEAQETNSEDGSKDPSPEKTKKKVSFFRQFSQKRGENKENKNPVEITSNNVDKTDEKHLEQNSKEDPDKSTNDRNDDEDTLDDEEDSETEEDSESEDEKDSHPQTQPGVAQKTISSNSNSNHHKKPLTTATASQGHADNNRIKSKSCSIL